jgi:hypothetical protein
MSLEILNFSGFKTIDLQRLAGNEHHFPDVRKMIPRSPFVDHFAGVNKMVPARRSGLKNEARIVANIVELLEA